jgi:ABC-type glycerol-3-phosphate transport system substrate-binding protein
MDPLLSSVGPIGSEKIVIKYVEKKKETLDQEFIEALASGSGPDLIELPHYSIAKNLDKLAIIPFESVSENHFKNTFLEEGELFLQSKGITALPFTIDPIVMYWNRDIFTNLSIVTPPTKWKDFYTLAPRVNVRDTSGNIKQSLVAFGEYTNVSNVKDILSMLILQSGSKIVEGNEDYIYSTIGRAPSSGVAPPAMGAVRFFMEFSKPDKDSYSWNRTLPNSRRMFEAGNLALYFGKIRTSILASQ